MPPHRLVRRWGRTLALLTVTLCLTSAQPAPAVSRSPAVVLDHDFADPDVVRSGGVFHAYATHSGGRHVQHATSRDLRHWTLDDSDLLPTPGAWAAPRPDLVWAPEVFDHGDGFTLQYTARDRASDRQCIGVARSASPNGPFRPVGDTPLICPAQEGGAIDAATYTEGGQRYILWKNDGNCCHLGKDTWLHLQPTSWDGTRVTGDPVRLIRQDQPWENHLVEAPTLIKRAGHYVLLYSANAYDGSAYATGYAVSRSLTGPYTKAPHPLMTTDGFSGAVQGPGGQDVVTGPDGRDRIVFHGWTGSGRALHLADLSWADGHPVVHGGKVIHQAERAHVHNASVRDAPEASDGKVVGYIDHPDSHVEFRVPAASAGPRTLSVRFANGSLDTAGSPAPATHRLSVNGTDTGVVHYPHTSWGTWRTAVTTITLKTGWNTITLSKGALFAELDYIEVG
ncbi:family 43 glycosylhydrolase [Streptomyces sp. CC219B]|uniref:family 43 glycosylhydrolase n=1 Tax=Streptomyces sp. CC219B TaxID=3044574 RepID=UPI0024A8CF53|nr:family 43 glycosylhydrolase [Streptomyces sp. CC219B]